MFNIYHGFNPDFFRTTRNRGLDALKYEQTELDSCNLPGTEIRTKFGLNKLMESLTERKYKVDLRGKRKVIGQSFYIFFFMIKNKFTIL